ncbi:hypothetical protein VTL71DRAFT_6467 [Oculimacula yallundae]|uniref:Nitrogen regulatory protein areA GATA-like domain-containing protein n=1 Tax=Oculimacula yallundae TaxID=86028 RepID=A0ABR4BX31_9HELO
MALILPKGIVVNSDQVNESIERIASEPLDQAQIAEFWKVYTTTKRRLLDPTAERLENYWWRIWYSDRKYLNGATIARLFDDISNGPTVVPLRGPPNRIEGPPTLPNKTLQHGPAAASTTALQQSGRSTNSGTTTTTSSSVSRPPAPMPHPILKKTRGPSTGGPRPTARFISPHESEHEGDDTSSVSPNSHVVVQPPSPDPRESGKRTTPRKKTGFSASTKKKRPVIVKRHSSQTSQSSEAAQAEVPSSLDGPPARTVSRFQENFSPSPERSASSQMAKKRVPDAKRSSRKSPGGKGRATSSKTSEVVALNGDIGFSQLRRVENLQDQEEGADPDPEVLEELEVQETILAEAKLRAASSTSSKTSEATVVASNGDPGPSSKSGRVKTHQREEEGEELTQEELEEMEVQRIMLAEANARLQRNGAPSHLKMARSKSPGSSATSAGVDAMRLVQHDSKGTPSLAPTLTDATGQLELGEVSTSVSRSPSSFVASSKEIKGKGKAAADTEAVDMFSKRPVTPANPAPVADTLSRSKSQLTLLLKKDKEKSSRNEKEVKRKK